MERSVVQPERERNTSLPLDDLDLLVRPVREGAPDEPPAPLPAPAGPLAPPPPIVEPLPDERPAPAPDPFSNDPLEALPPPPDPFANDPLAAEPPPEPAPSPGAPAAPAGGLVIRIRPRAPQAIGTPVEDVGTAPLAIGTPVTDDAGPPGIGTPVTGPAGPHIALHPAPGGPGVPGRSGRVRAGSQRGPRLQVRAQARPPATTLAGRVREALRCPFCHDRVGRQGSVACARRGCGALYHRACWAECVEHYGGCAAMGCGCTTAAGVTRVGFSWRVLRMALAALIFRPRALEALKAAGGDEADVAAIRRALEDQAREMDDALWGRRGRGLSHTAYTRWGLFQLAFVLGSMLAAFLVTLAVTAPSYPAANWLDGRGPIWGLFTSVAAGVAATLLLYRSTHAVALALYTARALLEGEVAALSRAGAGGGWIAQVRLGGGKKPG